MNVHVEWSTLMPSI